MRFFFFCVHSYISGVHLLLLLRSQLYLWGSPSAFTAISLGFTFFFFFFFCVPSYISWVHLLLLCSQLYLLGSPSSSVFPAISLRFTFFFFCVSSYIFGVHHSSSSAFPATSLGFTFFFCVPSYISGVHLLLLLLLCSQLYLWGSLFGVRFLHMWPILFVCFVLFCFLIQPWR